MPYATIDDFYTRYDRDAVRRLTDTADSAAGEPVETKVNDALAAAAREIDSYLAARYPLPFAAENTPAVLKDKTIDLAWAFLHRDFPTDASVQLASDTRRWLRDVSAGRVTLGRDAEGDVVAAHADGVTVVEMKERGDGGSFGVPA